jgi:hypothetical protein
MGRDYGALTAYLRRRPEPEVTLSFAELDDVIGGLPASARKYQAWWANSRRSQPHAQSWLDAGRRATVDFKRGAVRFTVGTEATNRPRITRLARHRRMTPGSLTPAGEPEELTLRFGWLAAGALALDPDGGVRFPRLPPMPGLYRFQFRLADVREPVSVYVGETDNLERRMASYRTPGLSQATDIRLNRRFRNYLRSDGTVLLDVTTAVYIDDDAADLTSEPVRRLAESAALVLLAERGAAIEHR